MKKFFKIIEKVVYAIAAVAIVAVIVLIILGTSANMHIEWQDYIPYMCLAAFLFAIYKALVIIFSSFYKIEITKKRRDLGCDEPHLCEERHSFTTGEKS